MQVTFTKVDGKRYRVAIRRERGPALVPRLAPGYDDLMPHDLAHYVVEEHYGIELGVWGQLAAGGGGIFAPAPEDDDLRHQRRTQRIAALGRDDMRRSEQLVVATMAAWERTVGRSRHQDLPVSIEVERDALRAAVHRMSVVSGQWRDLPYGGALSFTWPSSLTFDPARSHRGRRESRATRGRHRSRMRP
ncbi:hypothetical protein [Nocardioides sp.]|uniref:hypothetical protein n=1 Tax=Nocardioides sp. TaxID=35761 RepID=UPI002ED24C94